MYGMFIRIKNRKNYKSKYLRLLIKRIVCDINAAHGFKDSTGFPLDETVRMQYCLELTVILIDSLSTVIYIQHISTIGLPFWLDNALVFAMKMLFFIFFLKIGREMRNENSDKNKKLYENLYCIELFFYLTRLIDCEHFSHLFLAIYLYDFCQFHKT